MTRRRETVLAQRQADPPLDERNLIGIAERARVRSSPGNWTRAAKRFRRNRVAMSALFIFALIVIFVATAGLIAAWTGFSYQKTALTQSLKPPLSGNHVLGTDVLGRDILVRLAYGGRVSILIAGLAATLTLAIGATIGALSGYFGGVIDGFLMRCVDVLLCIPGLSLLILVSVLYNPGPVGLAVVLAIFGWAGLARLVRGEVLSLRARDYVEAARVIGASNARIIFRHIIPNVVPLMLIWISLAIPGLILAEATLSFLGFGVKIPTPSWGNMLEGAKDYYTKSWSNVFIPGLAIYLTVLVVNLVGNGLRDALDPRLSD